ncbi:MAG: ASPIC/UnbV domain-containing protein, partial [Acidobacteriota bacterium]
NDGDQDVIYHGGLDFGVMVPADNPGVLLQNQSCTGEFTYDADAIELDHRRRAVTGVALGDLDRNGFVDVVTASSFDLPEEALMVPSPAMWDAPFDGIATLGITWDLTPDGFVWMGIDRLPGSLTVELANGDNGHRSVTVQTVGSVGLTPHGAVNRNGIGAVIAFTPKNGDTVLSPVTGGSSFASQHSLERTFGLGDALYGEVDVLWPGGVRNRLERVRAGSHVVLPEIPCSYDAAWPSRAAFLGCVARSLTDLFNADVLSRGEAIRHFRSMRRAYDEAN